MIRGTTPAYTLTISGYDLTDQTVYVSVEARGKNVTLTGDHDWYGVYELST